MVSSAYKFLSEVDDNNNNANSQILWLKIVSLKVSIFVWQLLLNRIPAKDNLPRRQILATNDQICVANCGVDEDKDHLFLNCGFSGRMWPIISNWLGFATTSQGKLLDHILQFDGVI